IGGSINFNNGTLDTAYSSFFALLGKLNTLTGFQTKAQTKSGEEVTTELFADPNERALRVSTANAKQISLGTQSIPFKSIWTGSCIKNTSMWLNDLPNGYWECGGVIDVDPSALVGRLAFPVQFPLAFNNCLNVTVTPVESPEVFPALNGYPAATWTNTGCTIRI
ncbi:hypothetical protein, partial [Clostridium perfringens]|uniref:hypothetical protein n=1 Tax=Clostridium perfringens TaxID=1502 RepID=UPI002ACBDD9D